MSVAFVYVVVVVSEEEVCTFTVRVLVSARLSVIINLWSTSELSTRYFVVTYVPSYISVLSKGIAFPVLAPVISDIVTN